MQEQDFKNHGEESFFLENFNIDRVFNSIERADYLFLYYIRVCAENSEKSGAAYLSTLAQAMRLQIPELSKAVEKLQDKGYVLWMTDNEAGRTYVQLTSKAIELMADEKRRMRESYRRIREEIGEEELSQMIRTMKKVTAILKGEDL